MKRLRGSLLAYPIDYNTPIEETNFYNMSQIESDGIYSKLLLANRLQVMAIIERESSELRAQLMEDENCPEKCFIEQAITLLRDREGFVLKDDVAELATNIECLNIKKDDQKTIDEEVDDLDATQGSSSRQLAKYHYFYQGTKFSMTIKKYTILPMHFSF